MSKPKVWIQDGSVSDHGLHFQFPDELEARRFYLHLQHQGATATIDGTEATIYKHQADFD